MLTAKNRNRHDCDHVLSKVNGAEFNNCLGERIDAEPAYNKICAEHHLHHVVLKGGRVKNGLFHIQNINAYHSQIKRGISTMHGVASKYLTKYLGWFRMLDWHKYQKFSEGKNTGVEKFFEFKLLQEQQHDFKT